MAHGCMQVDRFDGIATDQVYAFEILAQPNQVPVVLPVACAPPAIDVLHVWRAADR